MSALQNVKRFLPWIKANPVPSSPSMKLLLTFGELFVSWAGPLDFGVWMMILAFAVCVGLAYSFIEEGTEGSDVDRDDPHHNRAASIFSALLLFTGGGGPAPRTFPGLFLLFGWSLFVLVLVNSYAANLGLGFRV